MITRIKKIEWWDPKSRQDAVTYKVWVEVNGQQHLEYFDNPTDLAQFQKTFLPKTKKAKPVDSKPKL